jgi:hypothetical protein
MHLMKFPLILMNRNNLNTIIASIIIEAIFLTYYMISKHIKKDTKA